DEAGDDAETDDYEGDADFDEEDYEVVEDTDEDLKEEDQPSVSKGLEQSETALDDLESRVREMEEATGGREVAAYSARTTRFAAAVLGLIGAVSIVTGAGLAGAVSMGYSVDGVSSTGAYSLSAALLAVGALVSLGAYTTYGERRWYYSAFAAALASLTSFPLGLLAFVLVALSEARFD
ncbi:MAG: hypothetical protein ACLFMT_02075, partial [Halobacteriales archaeon]